jgi:hypothetical protein
MSAMPGSRRRLNPNSEVSERDYFHAEPRGSRRDFLEIGEPKGFALSPLQLFRWNFRFGLKGRTDRTGESRAPALRDSGP